MPYKHLNESEREVISRLCERGLRQADIARCLGRSPSTISREVRRNQIVWAAGRKVGVYCAEHAQELAQERRRSRPIDRKLDDRSLQHYLNEALMYDWSPEQISGRIRLAAPAGRSFKVSTQTIYDWIHAQLLLTPHRRKHLRRGGKRYRRGNSSYRGAFPHRLKIEDRPKIAGSRKRLGDWEGDTVHGKGRSGFIATYVDRKSGYLMAAKLPNLEAQRLTDASRRLFKRIDPKLRKTLTVDNGVEFSDHVRFTRLTGVPVYFARPYCSTDRATNENTNGLLRQYFPKGHDFRKVTHQQLKRVVNQINNRPRKRLGYRTPAEIFNQQK